MIDLRNPPRFLDGKPHYVPNIFPSGALSNYTGVSDDVVNGVKFAGVEFSKSYTTGVSDIVEYQFIEWSYLVGGMTFYTGGKVGDKISFSLYAPATVGIENPGAGSFMKYVISPNTHIYIPYPNGGWDLDIDVKLNANVDFTKVVPIPAPGENTGYFDWDPITETMSVNFNGDGRYNLIDQPMLLAMFISKIPLIGSGQIPLMLPAVKPMRILPHWIHKITIVNSSDKDLEVGWILYLGKRNSV